MGDKISVRKTIYVLDSEALDRLNSQGNQSQYITDLILKDIKEKPVTKDEVVNIVQGMLKNCTVSNIETVQSVSAVNENVKNKAKKLMGL